MKRFLYTILILIILPSIAICQDAADEKGLARVRKQQGFDIYIYAEPLAEYEEVESFGNTMGTLSAIAGSNITIDEIVQSTINRAVKKNKKIEKEGGTQKIQAIIIYSNEKATGIRYTE